MEQVNFKVKDGEREKLKNDAYAHRMNISEYLRWLIDKRRKEDDGKMKYYWFTFSDGYSVCVKGFSKQELRVEENKHGKLLKKVEA